MKDDGTNPTSITSFRSRGCGYGLPPPHTPPHLLLTLLPVGHGLLALPKGAEEAVGAVGVAAAVLPGGPRGQTQPEVFITEVSVGTGGGGAARGHLYGGRSSGVRGARIHPRPWDGSGGQHRVGLGSGSAGVDGAGAAQEGDLGSVGSRRL